MLFFNKRKQLEQCFYEWCKDNDVPATPFNLISFLTVKDIINEDRAIEYLKGETMDSYMDILKQCLEEVNIIDDLIKKLGKGMKEAHDEDILHHT